MTRKKTKAQQLALDGKPIEVPPKKVTGRRCDICQERYHGRGTRILSGHTVCPKCATGAADLDAEVMNGN